MKGQLKPDRSLEFYRKKQKLSSLYFTSIVIGACIVFYLCIFEYANYVETMLIGGTILWVFPMVFGYYGYVAQWLYANYEEQKFRKPKDLFVSISKKLPAILIRPLFNTIHFPMFIPNKSPVFLAFAGSFIWSIWLMIFFAVILPRFN